MRIWLVTAPQVVTVDLALARPAPAMRTHTLASRLETSTPAQRGWITSIASSLLGLSTSAPGRAGDDQESDARARWQHSTVPVGALHHHADLQARTALQSDSVSYRDGPHQSRSTKASSHKPWPRRASAPPNLRSPRRALRRSTLLSCGDDSRDDSR